MELPFHTQISTICPITNNNQQNPYNKTHSNQSTFYTCLRASQPQSTKWLHNACPVDGGSDRARKHSVQTKSPPKRRRNPRYNSEGVGTHSLFFGPKCARAKCLSSNCSYLYLAAVREPAAVQFLGENNTKQPQEKALQARVCVCVCVGVYMHVRGNKRT